MSRIRYHKYRDSETILESVKRYTHPTNGARYKIRLYLDEHKWEIVDADRPTLVAASGIKSHPHKMKIAVRDALESLGIMLPVDEREKRK